MALIKCDECGKEISNKAPSCPNCGNPVLPVAANNERTIVVKDVVTTQGTAKSYKAQMLIGFALMGFGVIMMLNQSGTVGGWSFAIGLITFLAARASAWWHHG